VKLPSMPMFWGDFFNDTALKLTGEEAAYYAILLGHAWLNGGKIPDNDAMIANAIRVTPRKWASLKGPIMALWGKDDGGNYVQSRLNREYNYVTKKVETNRDNGSLGGRPKSDKKPNDINKTEKRTVSNGLTERITEPITETKANLHPYPKEESSSSKEALETETGDPPNGVDDDDLIGKIQKALGPKAPPNVVRSGLPLLRSLLAEGCDLERDLLVELSDIGSHLTAPLRTMNAPRWAEQVRARRDARLAAPERRPPPKLVFVAIETPQWQAWDAEYKRLQGKSPPTGKDGKGWHFPSEWPPGHAADQATEAVLH
jgi:uncharacterized protein YdaU (DUF1376 family)